jgi:alkanesulfonate monooxygenase SsuD/methylene tetrahydromethanopterin reductase-like flavin-dependent oxidoreductase (luciferase family)
VLTDGRFEMGVGTGRPGIEDELRRLGLPVLPPSERLARVRQTVTALRDLDGETGRLKAGTVERIHAVKPA